MEICGYRVCSCGCGRQELLHVLHLTGGLAWECFRDGRVARLRHLTIADGTGVAHVTLSRRKGKKVVRPRGQRGSDDTRRLAHAAREAARKRLAQIYAETYDILYADERHKRGLPIVPKRVPEGAFAAKVDEVVYSAEVRPGAMDADPHSTPA